MTTSVGGIKLDTTALDALARSLGTNTENAVAAIAYQLEGVTKANVIAKDIIDTGALLGSIHAEDKGDAVWWVADGVEYGIYQEFGTHRIAARPFMTPAVEAVNSQVADIVKKELFP
jgi:HK97 gp10 family phage protein